MIVIEEWLNIGMLWFHWEEILELTEEQQMQLMFCRRVAMT
jgi:hypothetical protein